MGGTFFDSFLPALTGAVAQAPMAGAQGHLQGVTTARDLAMLNQQIQLQQLQQQNLKQQMHLATRPQFMTAPQGAEYGTMDPTTGKYTMQGQVPFRFTPLQEMQTKLAEQQLKLFGGVKPGHNIIDNVRLMRAQGLPVPPAMEDEANRALREQGKVPGGVDLLSEPALELMSDQVLAGDNSPFQNLGRGLQGSENLIRLRQRVAEKSQQRGLSGSELAMRGAELSGVKAGERILGGRQANFGMAMSEAMQMADLVTQASNAFDRSNFPLANRAISAYASGTGDQNVVKLGAAITSFINAYARAINPTGVPTDSDKNHAREMLNTAQSKDQVTAVITQLKKEMEAAGRAPGMVKRELRESITGKEAATLPQSKLSSPLLKKSAPAGGIPTIKDDAEYNALPSGTEFMAPDGKRRKKP